MKLNISMKEKKISILLVLILILFGIEDVYAKRSKRFNCTEKITKAVARYKKKRYNDVKTILDQVKLNCGGHASMDTALYFLGKAQLATKQPVPASLEFEVHLQDFPKSPFREEVFYLLGVCSYTESYSYERDQTTTRDALREFENFLEMYPKSQFSDSASKYLEKCREKLVKKEVENARFYEKIDQFDAAIVYYKIIIEDFPQSSHIPESRLALARNLVKVNRSKEAAGIIELLLSSDTADTEVKKKARALLGRITKSGGIKQPESVPDSTVKEDTSL